MARPRSQSGGRELKVDPGPPPTDAEPVVDDEDVQEPPAPTAGEVVLEQLEEWETETVELVLGFFLMLLHWTVGRDGPPDAFVPDDAERRQMARPLTRVLNRSQFARRFATKGDLGAFAASFGGFVYHEAEDVARYRAARAGAPVQAPDADLPEGAVVHEEGVHVQGPVRRWRPPAVPRDEPA